MDRPFNVGIIGTGGIASKMAHTLRGMHEARLCAVASRSREKAESFASEYGAARAYGSYDEMLDDPGVDLVYIATPHSLHAEEAIGAIRRGKPVLCEKAFTRARPRRCSHSPAKRACSSQRQSGHAFCRCRKP